VANRRSLIEPGHPGLSIVRQCDLLAVSRSGYYYEPAMESSFNLMLMGLMDEQYTRCPFYGVPRMTAWLCRQGYLVNHKRIERLMRKMGIQGICPKPNLSKGGDESRKYPYLLGGLKVDHPNQVWCSDITYIRLLKGFVYLVAFMDWYSRFVLSWEISNTLDTHFCMEALERALLRGMPEIMNTDQGVQYTSSSFTSRLLSENILISMDGRGRAFDNIFIERLWRSVKYEEVYLKGYETVMDAVTGIDSYLNFYNHERLHQSLNYHTPAEIHLGIG
jgi:putative transposase